jgi:hypothetical protein
VTDQDRESDDGSANMSPSSEPAAVSHAPPSRRAYVVNHSIVSRSNFRGPRCIVCGRSGIWIDAFHRR